MSRIIFFIFAGRQANMEIQRPHIEALLADNPDSELHLWDLTRDEDDQHYLRRWAAEHEQVAYVGHLHPGHPIACTGEYRGRGHRRCTCIKHKPPYEEPYRYYRDNPNRGSRVPNYGPDTVFVKLDDDVVWMDTERFDEVLAFLETHRNSVASANVYNNVVCAKYEPALREHVKHLFGISGIDPSRDRDWWELHTHPQFAITSHSVLAGHIASGDWPEDREPFRSRPGEAVSINFIAMKYPTLCLAANLMVDGRLGDEGTVDSLLPWIIPNFRVAHLTFGPQEKALGPKVDALRQMYEPIGRI